ncbi:hypothetical protein PYCCODRAFT_559563 [Trametes coccinea BRFM310]|uniref:Uncharacterized protein n=1 Tax=Trametes coccinea (strain BRFM310) TaxID=1353009 RepID=A0A1Y2IIG4_TRAC3|nr:hypothetical protein PYCCODRAFT_559563 [Trametes coccinea BRFM310]
MHRTRAAALGDSASRLRTSCCGKRRPATYEDVPHRVHGGKWIFASLPLLSVWGPPDSPRRSRGGDCGCGQTRARESCRRTADACGVSPENTKDDALCILKNDYDAGPHSADKLMIGQSVHQYVSDMDIRTVANTCILRPYQLRTPSCPNALVRTCIGFLHTVSRDGTIPWPSILAAENTRDQPHFE